VSGGFDPAEHRRRLGQEIDRWNGLGRTLAGAFLAFAERRAEVGREAAPA
jgi:hypothetical protein